MNILSTPELKKRLRAAVDSGTLRFTQHALDRLNQRSLTVLDAERAARSGFHDYPRDCLGPNGLWRYRIQGKSVDGDDVKLAVEIDGDVVVVTVMD